MKRMIRRTFLSGITLLVTLLVVSHNALAATSFTFSVPASVGTYPKAINAAGAIAGFYYTGTRNRGFLRNVDGTLVLFDVAGANDTQPVALNAGGDVAGVYTTVSGGASHGFIRTAAGSFVTFDVPSSTNTTAFGINTAGDVAGAYTDGNGVSHGFVRKGNGSLTTFDAGNGSTVATAINSAGQITGYVQAGQSYTGFLRESDGHLTSFDAPYRYTKPVAINDLGSITGGTGTLFLTQGFLRTADGTMTAYQQPDTFTRIIEIPTAMNNSGQIVGIYRAVSPTSNPGGWLRQPDNTYSQVVLAFSNYTVPLSLNDAGIITGYVHFADNPGLTAASCTPSPCNPGDSGFIWIP